MCQYITHLETPACCVSREVLVWRVSQVPLEWVQPSCQGNYSGLSSNRKWKIILSSSAFSPSLFFILPLSCRASGITVSMEMRVRVRSLTPAVWMLITYHCCSSVHFGFVELIGFLDPVIGTFVAVLTGHGFEIYFFFWHCLNMVVITDIFFVLQRLVIRQRRCVKFVYYACFYLHNVLS